MNVRPGADWRVSFTRIRLHIILLLVCSAGQHALCAQCTLVCNSGVQVSLPSSGQFTLSPSLFVQNPGGLCPGALTLTVWEGPGQILPNNLATCDQTGQTLVVSVSHPASGNHCETEVTINDLLNPVLNCPARFVNCADNPDPAVIGTPAISDNCSPVYLLNVSYFDQTLQMPCGSLQNGIPVRERINRVWQVSDLSGNQSTCLEQIWLRAPVLDSVLFPINHDDFAAQSLACGQNPDDLALTGQPLLYGQPIDNGGPCEIGVTHADQHINGCSPGSYTILRTWTVIDFCTSQIKQRIQVIKLKDALPPVLTVPAAITLGTDETVCSGTVLLPQATATDLCSTVTIVPSWVYGSGFGPFTGVPKGNHIVTYTATDGCGNTATATTTVTIEDDDPPQVICTTSLQISLGSNGQAIVNTSALDAGSWDNCGVMFKSLSKNDSVWTNTVALTCQDAGIPVPVKLRVADAAGMVNYCVVLVTARDFLKPTITCPANLSINCLQDQNNISITGQPAVTDNCNVGPISHADVIDLSTCNIGTILRTWTASDLSGNSKTCVQTITLTTFPPPTVVFPTDITLNGCSAPISLAPGATGSPQISGQSCFPPSVTYVDQIFNIAAPACFVVMRKWTVIDQCNYNPNGGSAGYWQHTQQINVTDQSPPLLVIPADITASSGPSGCDAWVDLPDAVATDCSPALSVSHNSAYATSGWNASGWYPAGIHQVTYTASDGCGNSVQKILNITVSDLLPPVAVCINGLAINLTPGGYATILPAMLDGGSYDNCSGTNLTFAITPQGFSCQHVGQQQVTLYVTDNSGNTGQCQTYVQVQDNQQVCARHTISGRLLTPEGLPVRGISVSDGQGDLVMTDSSGQYLFDSLLPGKNYVITPFSNSNWLNGVTAYDLILISRHILGLEPINTPERIIAADVNNSGTITTFDIVQLRKVLLGSLDSIPSGKSWRFIPASFVFQEPSNPFGTGFPEAIEVIGLDANLTGKDFVAVKSGDVDHSADPMAAFSPAILVYRKMMNRILQHLANDN